MNQHPNHNPENHHASALQEMSWEQLREFFALYPHNTARGRKSSDFFLTQLDLSVIFDYVAMHRILPQFDIDVESVSI